MTMTVHEQAEEKQRLACIMNIHKNCSYHYAKIACICWSNMQATPVCKSAPAMPRVMQEVRMPIDVLPTEQRAAQLAAE